MNCWLLFTWGKHHKKTKQNNNKLSSHLWTSRRLQQRTSCVHDRDWCRSAVLSMCCLGFNLNCQVLGCYVIVVTVTRSLWRNQSYNLLNNHLEKDCREGIIVYTVYSFVVLINVKSLYFKRTWADQLLLTALFFSLSLTDWMQSLLVFLPSERKTNV